MQHEYIENNQVIDRYLSDRLTEEEERLFEEHFLHCSQCLEQLEAGRAWRRGLREVAAATGWKATAASPPSSWRWPRTAAAIAAGLLLAAIPSAVLLYDTVRERDSMLADLQARLEEAETKSASEARSTQALRDRIDQIEGRQESERSRLEGLLADSGREQSRLRNQLAQAFRPQANAIVYPLGIERGGQDASLVISPGPPEQAFVLSVDLGFGVEGQFRVRLIRESDGAVLWRQSGLKPDSSDSLHILFRSQLFERGLHRLRVERTDRQEPLRDYRFRVDR